MGEYVVGSKLVVPGLEAVLEYGDSSSMVRDRIPGAMQINDLIATSTTAVNLIRNPSFESGYLYPWIAAGIVPSIESGAWAAEGTKSIRVVCTSSGYLVQTGISVVELYTYTVRLAKNVVSQTGLGNCYVHITWRDASNTVISATGLFSNTPGSDNALGVHDHVGTVTTPAGATTADFHVYFNGTGFAGSIDCYIDAIGFLDGAFSYFDGDFYSCEWDGIRHLSSSRMISVTPRTHRVRLTNIDGIHADPGGRVDTQENSDRHGESSSEMLYPGRTIGLTGFAEAGSIPAVRDQASRFMNQFGIAERDLVIHPPNEVQQLVNSLPDPGVESNHHWSVSWEGTGSPSLNLTVPFDISTASFRYKVGKVAVGSLSSTGTIHITSTPEDEEEDNLISWSGEDVFIAMSFRATGYAGVTISQIRLGLLQFESKADAISGNGEVLHYQAQATPTDGQWYGSTLRIVGDSILPSTRYLSLVLMVDCSGSSGSFSAMFDDAVLVLLGASDPTPAAYFAADVPGYENAGAAGDSKSSGPKYAVNMIPDPEFVGGDPLIYWHAPPSTGVTVLQDPIRDPRWSGDYVSNSMYAKLQKDNNSTDRLMVIAPRLASDIYFRVWAGRTYRWRARLNVRAKPSSSGGLSFEIAWFDYVGNFITAHPVLVGSTGVLDYTVTGTAPVGAVAAQPRLATITGTANGVLEVNISDPCFIDITDIDAGDFYGVDEHEQRADPAVSVFSTRRIGRPFLIRRVRKASEGPRSPEVQVDMRFRREVTVGLRASDPRIYVIDDRRRSIKMEGVPEFVSIPAPTGFSLETAGIPAPTGFTYEGHYLTHPGTGAAYRWSQRATAGSASYANPAGGVIMRTFDEGGTSAAWGSNRPASTNPLKARMYRSLEGYTYENPRVILGAAPGIGISGAWARGMAHATRSLGGGLTTSNTPLDTDRVIVLLKRVSSTTWLELRWNSWAWAEYVANSYTANPDAHHEFELWCSHNTSGSLTTTRLASWDYQSFDASSLLYPFDRVADPMWITAWMVNNVVRWELWKTYPSSIPNSYRIESGSYLIPSALQSVIGSSVAGHAGWGLEIDNKTQDQLRFIQLAYTPPYMHYFEASNATVPPQTMSIPVVGTIDTEPIIELRGDLVDPIITITTPAFDDRPIKQVTAKFIGTAEEARPIIVDLSTNTIRDSQGLSREDMLVPGSSFARLTPGVNLLSVQAKGWSTTVPAHAIVSWRDALKSG